MKLLIVSFLVASAILSACGDSEESSTDKFRDMSREDSFKQDHDEPLGISDSMLTGENLRLNIKDAKPAQAYFLRHENSKNYLILFHEWWGLNTHIKMEAEKYFRDLGNVNVLALDLYDGEVAATQDKASQLTSNADDDRIKQIIERAIAYCGPDAKIATLGWCFGGGWSLQTAIMGGEKIDGCVMYYGMPEEDMAQLKKIQAPVLGVFGNKDGHITPSIVNEFEKDMNAADKKIEIHRYDAVHAFANPSNPNHDKKATEDARQKTLSFLQFIFGRNNS